MAKAKKDTTEPTVVKGSHLTVYTYPNGKKKLEWDDEALMRDVLEAMALAANDDKKPAVKAKAARKKKTANV